MQVQESPNIPFTILYERFSSGKLKTQITHYLLLGSTVVSPYVGMARKQNGGFNASISVQTPLVHLVANCTHQKTVRSAL